VSAAGGAGPSWSRRLARLRVGQSLSITIGALLAFAVIGIGLALVANERLTDSRNLLLNQIGPSLRSAIQLESGLVNQETGLRGYLIAVQASFLEPYQQGLKTEASAFADLRARTGATGPRVARQLAQLRERVNAWRSQYVTPSLRAAARMRRVPLAASLQGKSLFDAIRRPLASLLGELNREDVRTRSRLSSAASQLQAVLVAAGVLILGSLLGAGVFLREMITGPLARLGAEANRVAGGEFTVPMAVEFGPREIADMGLEIDAMRERIVRELALVSDAHVKLARQAEDLRRSNAELEQFAYVASHDLQEPLRKVASFCQALQLRYGDSLDERATQYIEFAVDGAKRMQLLINALLALSRVGRGGEPTEAVALGDAVASAERSLADEIRAAGATLHVESLPVVRGERALLISLFQNLIGNAVKFRGSEPPVVHIACRAATGEWELSIADNGIGIDPEYAERIFQIFQRLHTRDSYEGTGIGLALCRKIVERHGGRISLDPAYSRGARFWVTLPMADLHEDKTHEDGSQTEAPR
jgi:signal transduction histidine kinase